MPATVIYDGDCGFCTRVKSAVEALDWLNTMRWIPLQSGEAAAFGIPRARLEHAVFLVTSDGSRHEGWRAVKRMLARLPLVYVLGAALVRKSPWTGVALSAMFSPPFNPLGERGYQLVARNRHRLPASTCPVPIWDNRSK